jgi:aldehyde dehydrogenase (NAD+)
VRIANDSDNWLSGAVYGADLDRARSIAARLRTGTVGVNGGQWFGADSPFGGFKQSGVGREMGLPGFEEYTEIQTVAVPAGS